MSIGLLLGASLALSGWSAYEKRHRLQSVEPGPAIQVQGSTPRMRSLNFRDEPDSSISVTDAQTGEQLASIEGEAGFARSVLRSLARARMRVGLGPEQPFELRRSELGGLVLLDPQTAQTVDLTALGPTNAVVFAVYLK